MPGASHQGGAASSALIVGLVLLVAIGGLWWWQRRPAEEAPASLPPTAAPAAASPAPVQPVTAAAEPSVERQAPAVPTPGKLLYACGQEAPALNGVTESIKLDWAGPWSPIQKIVVERGWEWYVHEDGSRSTTQMIDMNGVPQAMALRAQPTEPLPLFDQDALQRLRRR